MARRTQMQGSFPLKLHLLLNTVHDEGLEWIVSWSPQGNRFKVHKVEEFVTFILPRFFMRQTKYKSFQRQLNIWDFDRITKGPFAGSYVHSKFLRGHPHLCLDMVRHKQVSVDIREWPWCEEKSTQHDVGRNWGVGIVRMKTPEIIEPPINEPTMMMDFGFHDVLGSDRPMTLSECLAFFYEKDRMHNEWLIATTNPLKTSMLPPVISFDNPFEESFSSEDPLEPIHIQAISSNPSSDCSLRHDDDRGMRLPFNSTNLIEPAWLDFEKIFW